VSRRSYDQFCAVAQALDQIGERWTLLLIRDLLPGPARFGDLMKSLPGLASNLLTQRLRSLEEHGLVVQDTLPPPAGVRVYRLTAQGRALTPTIEALASWGMGLMQGAEYRDPGNVRSLACALGVILRPRAMTGDNLRLTLRIAEQDVSCTIRDGDADIHLGPAIEPQATVSCDYSLAFRFVGGIDSIGAAIRRNEAALIGDAAAVDLLDLIRERPAT